MFMSEAQRGLHDETFLKTTSFFLHNFIAILSKFDYNFKNFLRIRNMAQVPENIGCENPDCIAKDECKRQVVVKNGTAVEVKTFGGTPEKKCGKFIQK